MFGNGFICGVDADGGPKLLPVWLIVVEFFVMATLLPAPFVAYWMGWL